MVQKLNLYLTELWQDPPKEFIKFLQKDSFNPGIDNFTCNEVEPDKKNSGFEDLIDKNKNLMDQGLGYLRKLWCCESTISIKMLINYSSFEDQIIYTFCVTHRDKLYESRKTLVEIRDLYNLLRGVVRGVPLPSLPNNITAQEMANSDKISKIEESLKILLNDADYFCGELTEFFSCELTGIFSSIFQINKNRDIDPITLQDKFYFSLQAHAEQYGIDVAENTTRLVYI